MSDLVEISLEALFGKGYNCDGLCLMNDVNIYISGCPALYLFRITIEGDMPTRMVSRESILDKIHDLIYTDEWDEFNYIVDDDNGEASVQERIQTAKLEGVSITLKALDKPGMNVLNLVRHSCGRDETYFTWV